MTAIPLQGDRSARDVISYPALHANDLPGTPKYHVPIGASIGDMLIWDGAKWVAQVFSGANVPIITLGSREGNLVVTASPFRIYNQYGSDRSVSKVFLSVGTAPTGADIIVDVKKNGTTSIFAAGQKPKIVAGSYTGFSTAIDIPTWVAGDYLTWEITQIGSAIVGADLVVQIVHTGLTTSGMLIAAQEGDLIVNAFALRTYNNFGLNRTLTKVFLAVNTAPTGSDLIVDVLMNGVSIFTSGNRPKIVAGAYTGYSVTIASPGWAQGSYITWEIAQVGSAIPGSNLTVHIIHGG